MLDVIKRFMPRNFNDALALIFMGFILVSIILVCFAVRYLTLTTVESLGLGTVVGILLAILKDIFQYYFRKAHETKPDEK